MYTKWVPSEVPGMDVSRLGVLCILLGKFIADLLQ